MKPVGIANMVKKSHSTSMMLSPLSSKSVNNNGTVPNGQTNIQNQHNQQNTNTNTTNNNSNSPTITITALVYMMLLAIQFGIQPLVTRKYTPSKIIRSTVVLVQEVVKLCIAFTLLQLSGNSKQSIQGWTITTWISVAIIPAALYSIQNIASITAYQNLDALTFNVLNQTKTLSAAICCYLLMGLRQSPIQIIALFILLLSALVIEGIVRIDSVPKLIMTIQMLLQQQQQQQSSTTIGQSTSFFDSIVGVNAGDTRHYTHGVIPLLVASFISGLAGAVSQRSLQKNTPGSTGGGRNIYLFSIELCIASILLLSASLTVSQDGTLIKQYGFWYGWDYTTCIPILTNSAGGILVGLVTKYAGSVQKGFALIFGILLSGIIQSFVQPNKSITNEQLIGGLLAATSLYLHASFPPSKKSDKVAITNTTKTTTNTLNNNGKTSRKSTRTKPLKEE